MIGRTQCLRPNFYGTDMSNYLNLKNVRSTTALHCLRWIVSDAIGAALAPHAFGVRLYNLRMGNRSASSVKRCTLEEAVKEDNRHVLNDGGSRDVQTRPLLSNRRADSGRLDIEDCHGPLDQLFRDARSRSRPGLLGSVVAVVLNAIVLVVSTGTRTRRRTSTSISPTTSVRFQA